MYRKSNVAIAIVAFATSFAIGMYIIFLLLWKPAKITFEGPTANIRGQYSLSASVENLPKGVNVDSFSLRLGRQIVSTSTDGNFSMVPFSPGNGMYVLSAYIDNGDSLQVEVNGFDFVPSVEFEFASPKSFNKCYSFSVKVKNVPQNLFVRSFKLCSGNTIVSSSESGSFSNIPSSSDSGRYTLSAMFSNGEVLDSLVSGFDPIQMINPMTIQELESLINSCDSRLELGQHSKVVSNPRIILQNSKDPNDASISLISDVHGRLRFHIWSRVEVQSVEYNSQNQINQMTLYIHY